MSDKKDNVVNIFPFAQEKHPKHLEDLSNLLDTTLPQLTAEQKDRLLKGVKPFLDEMRSPPAIRPDNTEPLDAFINRAVTVAVTASLLLDAYKMLYDEGNKNE